MNSGYLSHTAQSKVWRVVRWHAIVSANVLFGSYFSSAPMADLSADNAPGKPKKKLRTIAPIPPVPGWQEELGALKDLSDTLALSLWRMLRNVRVWHLTDPTKRAGLFNLTQESQENMGFACAEAPQLIEPFGVFAFMRRAPGQVGSRQVANACRQVSDWAESRSLMLTGVHFAEAAAIVDAEDPALANHAAMMCRRGVLYERSATWYERAFGLAVRLQHSAPGVSRDQSIRALLGYGSLMQFLGRFAEAKKFYDRAATRAKYLQRRSLAAQAMHDLLTFAAELGPFRVGLHYAASALDLYAINAPQIPGLVHDWGFLLVQHRHYSHAIPVLKLTTSLAETPGLQALFWGTLARAAAGAQRVELAEEAKQKAFSRIQVFDEYAPAVLIHLTESARALGQWEEARTFADLAVESSRERKVVEPERIALDLVQQVKNRIESPPEEPPLEPRRVETLNHRMIARLRRWKAPGSRTPEAPPAGPGNEAV